MSEAINNKPILPSIISFVLVVALGISLAKLMWLILTPEQKLVLNSQTTQVASTNTKEVTNYGKLIADQHIFGEVVIKKNPVKPKVVPTEVAKPVVPKVKVNAKLHGIVAYKSRKSFALISTDNGKQKVYAEGDALKEGVLVSNILPTKVEIDNSGTIEELLLPKIEDKKSSKRAAPNLPNYNANLPTGNNARAANKPDLNQFRQEIIANPAKLTDIVRASPAIINGQFSGFRIRSGKNRKLFRELGFRSNDIITEINGIVLDSANKGVQVLAEFEGATDLSIKVKRGNQELQIDHSF